MIRKKLGLMLAAGLVTSQFTIQPQISHKKIFMTEHSKIQQVEQVKQKSFFCAAMSETNLNEDGFDSSKCTNCKSAGNCSGCIVFQTDNTKEWVSLDELPQLD
jgi:predicted transcriptional regulator